MVESHTLHKQKSLADSMLEFKDRFSQSIDPTECFSCKFNREGSYLAMSFQDGSLHIVSPMLGDKLYHIKDEKMVHPITRLCWKPFVAREDDVGTQYQQLYGSCVDGSVVVWDHNNPLEVEHRSFNPDNQYMTVDIANDGRKIALAGKLNQIEIWDDVLHKMTHCYTKAEKCHDNTIFSTKFSLSDPNMLISGSWDRCVKLWDLRTGGGCVQRVFGTQTCADSIDLHIDGHTMVTGGGTGGEGLQIWDWRNPEKVVRKLTFSPGVVRSPMIEPFINGVKFLPRTQMIVAAATDADVPTKVFNYQTGALVKSFPNKCGRATAMDTTPDGAYIGIADMNGGLQMINTAMKQDVNAALSGKKKH